VNTDDTTIATLEKQRAVLANDRASAAELNTAAEHTRAMVPGLDEVIAAAQRQAEILAAMRGATINKTLASLMAADEEVRQHALLRKAAAWLAAAIDARAREVEKVEPRSSERGRLSQSRRSARRSSSGVSASIRAWRREF
jgi:hypothetical protein